MAGKMSFLKKPAKPSHDQSLPSTSFEDKYKMAKTMFITLEGSANALALNKDANKVVVAGRNVFKLLSIEEEEFLERVNLRVGKNINLNYSYADVVWHPVDENILATAATNGDVVIWDLNKTTRSKQDVVFQHHKRTVNKVTFHPTEPYMLLSGSQDGTMKNFDLRIKDEVCSYVSNSDSVRDVQFSPHHHCTFAAVKDNGQVQMWDLRRPEKPEKNFTGHTGPVFACDWHPEERKWFATAGRDKTIKVWDLTGKPTVDYNIATIASVTRIKWRPQRKFHIASSSLVVDFSVNVWDLRRPYIPFAAFVEHKDVATGIAWRNSPRLFLSTSKDSMVYQHVFRDADRPADRANPMGLDINCAGHIALASSNRILDESVASKQNSKTMPAFFRKTPTLGELFPSCTSSCFFFEDPSDKILSLNWLVASARRYLLTGKPFEELCDHNAAVAADLGRFSEASTWNFLKLFYGANSAISPAPDLPTKNLLPEVVRPDADSDNAVAGSSNAEPSRGPDAQGNDTRAEQQSRSGGQGALQDCRDGYRGLQYGSETSTGLTDEDTETEDTDQWGTLTNLVSFLSTSSQQRFWEGEIGYSPGLFSSWDDPPEEEDDEEVEEEDIENWTMPYEAITPRHELTMTHTPPPEQLCLAAFSPRMPNAPPARRNLPPTDNTHTDRHDPITIKPEAFVMPIWDCTPTVQNMLNYYAERGDVQMAVVALIVLGNRLKEGTVDENVQEQWYTSYIDLLTRFQLWSEANEVIKLSPLPAVNSMNQQSTTMHTNCNKCARLLQWQGWMCDRCKEPTNGCSICHRMVKGLYVWCQGCSHGGHLQHMQEWFKTNPWCPTGCGHLCEYT